MRLLLKFLYFKAWNIRFRILYFVAWRRQQLHEAIAGYSLAVFKEFEPRCTAVQSFFAPLPGYDRTIGFDVCIEAPMVYLVHIDGAPALGMAVEVFGDTLSIRQLQGQKGFNPPPSLRQWPKLFVEACKAAAEECGINRLRLYRANQDLFYKEPYFAEGKGSPDQVEAVRRRMRRRYDGTARQMGFEMHKRWGELRLA